MSRQNNNAGSANLSAGTIPVTVPKNGHPATITVTPGCHLNLDFDPAEADYSRQGTDLVVTSSDGNAMTLAGFFAAGSESPPSFILPDGTHATAQNLFTGIDLSLAAGPSAADQNGNGIGEYIGDGGELIGGIDRLGDADSTYWNQGLETLRQTLGSRDESDDSVVSSVTPPVEPPPVGPGITLPPFPPPAMYTARAVLYKTAAAASDTVRFRLLDGNNEPVDPSDPSVTFTVDDDNGYFDLSTLVVNADGTQSLSLSGTGLAALASAGNTNIYEYLTVTVNGHEYRMQVVVNQSGDFDAAAENAASNNGNSSGHEWHSETGGAAVGVRHGDQGDNEVWFAKNANNDGAFKGSFTGSDGNDTINIENTAPQGYGMGGGTTLDTGAGRDSVSVKGGMCGMRAWQSAEHNSITNAETVTIENGDYGMFAVSNGTNSVMNAENVTVSGRIGMCADSGGTNVIRDAATVSVNGDGRGLSADKGDNLIMAGDGKVSITSAAGYGIYAGTGGCNTVSGSDISLTGDTAVASYHSGARNIIESRGDVSVNGSFGVYTYGGANTIKADGKVSITGTGSASGGSGLHATHGGTNAVTGNEISITNSGGSAVDSLYEGSRNIIEARGDVSVNGANGLHAAQKGENTIMTEDGRVTINATHATSGYGIYAEKGGANTVTGSVISVTGDNYAIAADRDNARNTIEAKGDVSLHGGRYGLYAHIGDNTIKAANGTVTIIGTQNAGLSAVDGGTNTVTGTDVNISSEYAALFSLKDGNNIVTASGNLTLNATSAAGSAYGLCGHGNITADSVTMTIKGKISAIAMDGKGTVTANFVRIDAESDSGTSYGMQAGIGQTNTVQSAAGHALVLEINADYAMYSSGGNNVITGGSQAGSQGDQVRINGDISGANGRNCIITGAGDDVIIIDGSISGGALYLDGGAGSDTLMLVASSLTEFIARYGAWLNSLDAVSLKGIESIVFSGVSDLNDLSSALNTFLSYAGSNGISVSLQEIAGANLMSVLNTGDVDSDSTFDDGQDSLVSQGNEGSNGMDMGLGDYAAHLGVYAVHTQITSGADHSNLYPDGNTDVLEPGITSGNVPDFFAFAGSGISISEILDLSHDNADGPDIDSLLSDNRGDNEFPNKGDPGDKVDFSSFELSLTGNSVSTVYENVLAEYVLMQKITNVTG